MQPARPEFEQTFVILRATPGDREILKRIFSVDQLCLDAEAARRLVDDDSANLVPAVAKFLDRHFGLRHLGAD